MIKFKLPKPLTFKYIETGDGILFPEDIKVYTDTQLHQALTDLGDAIAGRFSNPYSNYDLVIKHITKEMIG